MRAAIATADRAGSCPMAVNTRPERGDGRLAGWPALPHQLRSGKVIAPGDLIRCNRCHEVFHLLPDGEGLAET